MADIPLFYAIDPNAVVEAINELIMDINAELDATLGVVGLAGVGVPSHGYATLALADAAAIAAGQPLWLNSAYSLSANTTVASPVIVTEGSVTLNGYNLILDNTINAPLSQWIVCDGVGTVTISQNTQSELRWFAAADGVTDDTNAVQTWVGSSLVRHASAASYLTDTITIPAVSSIIDGSILGDGFSNTSQTHFISMSGNDVFTFTASKYVENFTIGNFYVSGQGASTGTGYAVHIPSTVVGFFNSTVQYIYAVDMGGGCLKDEIGFTADYIGLLCNTSGLHCFDVKGNNTVYMRHCYAFSVPTGYTGYRIHSGCVLDNCNGVNSGGIWGIFGESTTDITIPAGITGGPLTIPNDGRTTYSTVRMQSCNVEDYATAGIVVLNGSVYIDNRTTMTAKSSGVVAAIYLANACPTTLSGAIENYGRIISTKGATFYNSCPIQSPTSSTAQFFNRIGYNAATYVPIWDYTGGAQRNFSAMGMTGGGFTPDGVSTNILTTRFFKPDYLAVATLTPASAAATGVAGQIAWDASYIYICTATNTWKRVAIATW